MDEDARLREYLRRAVRELQEARQRLREVEPKLTEPIEIIGTACRFPRGVQSPEDLWRLVAEERNVVSEFPTDRGWRPAAAHDEPGMTTIGLGGFLDGATDFDAGFFGVSEREAGAMDPQQRLLLEVAREVVERARIAWSRRRPGSNWPEITCAAPRWRHPADRVSRPRTNCLPSCGYRHGSRPPRHQVLAGRTELCTASERKAQGCNDGS